MFALKAERSGFEIARFLKVELRFVVKVGKELKASDGDSTPVAKRKTRDKGPNTIRKRTFLRKEWKSID